MIFLELVFESSAERTLMSWEQPGAFCWQFIWHDKAIAAVWQLVASALQRDRNRAARRSTPDFSLNSHSTASYRFPPVSLQPRAGWCLWRHLTATARTEICRPYQRWGYWLCAEWLRAPVNVSPVLKINDVALKQWAERSSKSEMGLIKERKQIFHPAWFLTFLKETSHLNENLIAPWKKPTLIALIRLKRKFRFLATSVRPGTTDIFFCVLYISFSLFVLQAQMFSMVLLQHFQLKRWVLLPWFKCCAGTFIDEREECDLGNCMCIRKKKWLLQQMQSVWR